MTNNTIHIEKRRIVRHSAFWTCWVFGFTFIQSFGFGIHDLTAWLFYYLVTLPLFMAHTYLIAYWLVPAYFYKKRYWLLTGWIIILLILASVSELIISNEFVWTLVKTENRQTGNYLEIQNIIINGLGNEYVVLAFLAIKIFRFWNLKMDEKEMLMNKRLSSEIEILNNQSYPQFILNIIGKLEIQAQNHSSQTSEMIIRLSNILNSMINENYAGMILLTNEMERIKNYIGIRQMSNPSGYNVNLEVSGNVNGLKIPPLLFFQLVEEGFNLLDEAEVNSEMTVLIKSDPKILLFTIILWNPHSLNRHFSEEITDNCKKLLKYFYPRKHRLILNSEINFMEVSIEIF